VGKSQRQEPGGSTPVCSASAATAVAGADGRLGHRTRAPASARRCALFACSCPSPPLPFPRTRARQGFSLRSFSTRAAGRPCAQGAGAGSWAGSRAASGGS
jgi:hypothetical protein